MSEKQVAVWVERVLAYVERKEQESTYYTDYDYTVQEGEEA